MMEAASTSETSVNFYQTTRRNNPEDSHLQTRHCYQVSRKGWVFGKAYFGPLTTRLDKGVKYGPPFCTIVGVKSTLTLYVTTLPLRVCSNHVFNAMVVCILNFWCLVRYDTLAQQHVISLDPTVTLNISKNLIYCLQLSFCLVQNSELRCLRILCNNYTRFFFHVSLLYEIPCKTFIVANIA
jgi:hypothetical protein